MKCLSDYLLQNEQFFDTRNISMAHVEGSLLAAAFKVKLFHRSQINTLVNASITPITFGNIFRNFTIRRAFIQPALTDEPEITRTRTIRDAEE